MMFPGLLRGRTANQPAFGGRQSGHKGKQRALSVPEDVGATCRLLPDEHLSRKAALSGDEPHPVAHPEVEIPEPKVISSLSTLSSSSTHRCVRGSRPRRAVPPRRPPGVSEQSTARDRLGRLDDR